MADLPSTKARLESQLAELEGRETRIAVDLSEPLSPDSSEQAVEMEDDAALEAEASLVAREIVSVKRALARIEAGTYGKCVRCGAEIASERLEARPEAALCIECAQRVKAATPRLPKSAVGRSLARSDGAFCRQDNGRLPTS